MAGVAEALAPFLWGAGGKKKSRSQVESDRAVAAALAARNGAPQNVGEGLNRIGEALRYNALSSRADKAEEEGRASFDALWGGLSDGYDTNELMALAGNEWASGPQSAVATALLQQDMRKRDPEYQLDLELKQAQLEAARQPAPVKPPPVEERYNPETGRKEKVQWDGAQWVPFGGMAAPDKPLVSVDVNNGGADEEFYKAGAKSRGEMFAGIEEAGFQAQSKIGQVNRLEQLLATSPQGFEGAAKQIAGEFGIATDGLSDIQAAQALINKLVPEQRQPGSGPMSDADLALFKQSLPRILNQPDGNALIVQTLKGIAVYEQALGEIATRVLNKEITPAEGRALMAQVPNPLELFRKGGASPSDPGNVPEGVDPEDWAVMTPKQRALWD